MLPLDPEFMNSTIHNLCAGSHSGSAITDCFLAFRSEEAAKAVADEQSRKMKCEQLAQRIESGKDKDWLRREPRTKEQIREMVREWQSLGGGSRDPDPDLERQLANDNSLRYFYNGNDPTFTEKGIILFLPTECEFRSLTHRYQFNP
jgi:hypothetical protein